MGEQLAASCDTQCVSVSAYDPDASADWVVSQKANNIADAACDFTLTGKREPNVGREEEITVALPGEVNVQDAAVAYLMLTGIGIPVEAAKAGLARLAVPGRLEIVSRRNEGTPLVINDYAHTPEALASILRTMQEFTPEHYTWYLVPTEIAMPLNGCHWLK